MFCHPWEGHGLHSIPNSLWQPEGQFLTGLPEDSLGACHSAGLGKRNAAD